MKKYTEYKSIVEMGKTHGVPEAMTRKVQMRVDLAVAIMRHIKKNGYTQAQAAKKAMVGRTVVTALMNSNVLHISTEKLIDIAHNLGLTVILKIAS